MPPSALTSSGARPSSRRSVRHDSPSAPAFTVSDPTSCRRSRSDSSTITGSGFAGAALPTKIAFGRTSSVNGPPAVSVPDTSVSLPSVVPIAGCPVG
jgi:hypothetical protein